MVFWGASEEYVKGLDMNNLAKYSLGLICLGVYINSYSASFDCSNATQRVEKMICSDIRLSTMDSNLYSTYIFARRVVGNSSAFKANGKNAIKWRNHNCTTSKCIEDWYFNRELELEIIGSTGFVAPSSCVVSGSYSSVRGRIVKETYPGLPNYESVKNGDKPMTYWFLKTEKPICSYKSDMTTGELTKIASQNKFQLVIDNYGKYKNKQGKLVTVHGMPYSRHTGYHNTALLIEVANINLDVR